MSSLIEGYNYDIFISYRQKDNKGDRWVSEFVEALKTELESTFKEDISVYFDINPHDGLLETHDVDASLKDKLKCLVFIPVISRTYCDPKSFAWEHEFKAFVEQASKDPFGMKVKLPNGNVASRVLPVRIHDLDVADIKECESVLGGVLRGIEFIYKESGIDKPLTTVDDEKKNLNNTKYIIQMIKVAHAIKEIIFGMKAEPSKPVREREQHKESFKEVREDGRKIDLVKPANAGNRKLITIVALFALFVFAVIIFYPRIFRQDTLEKLKSSGERISVAVLPFQNMTGDTLWNMWQEGIQNELITSLTNSEELIVRQIESITWLLQSKGLTNYASITRSVASTLSQKLDAKVFINGSIKQSGNIIRINAQLIDSETEEALKSFQVETSGNEENIFRIIDSLSLMVKNFLILTVLEKQLQRLQGYQQDISTNSPEAFRYYINGLNAFMKKDFPTSRNWLFQSYAIDSNFFMPALLITNSYGNQLLLKEAREWSLKLYNKMDQLTMVQKIQANSLYTLYCGNLHETIKYLKQLIELRDQSPHTYYQLGIVYNLLNQYDKSIPEFKNSLEIYKKWGIKPWWVNNYTMLGYAYHNRGQYKEERKIYKQAEKDFPDDPDIISGEAVLSFTEGDTVEANEDIRRLKTLLKENSVSEAEIASKLGELYENAGILDEAEKYFRQAAALDTVLQPINGDKPGYLAWFLINTGRNINKGVELINKCLKIYPENSYYLATKGWGLYKLGKNKEALELLEKARELRLTFPNGLDLYIEEVKKAVASQKNN
jgi:tetratricopeptide (TPR) repeat protein